METNTPTPSHYYAQALEISKFLNRHAIITMIAVLSNSTFDDVYDACADPSDDVVIAMLATTLMNYTK